MAQEVDVAIKSVGRRRLPGVYWSVTYASALLGLTKTGQAEAEKDEVDDHSHLDELVVLFC